MRTFLTLSLLAISAYNIAIVVADQPYVRYNSGNKVIHQKLIIFSTHFFFIKTVFYLKITSLIFFSIIVHNILNNDNIGCQLLLNNTRIYCYSGGYAKTVNLDVTPLADHYYLDVSKDFVVANSYNLWTRVVDPPNFVTEATFGYVSVKLSDTSVLLNGGTGINDGKSFMKNQTVIYHADRNQWETIANTTSFPQRYVKIKKFCLFFFGA
jgi:hypothetical protein